MGSRVLFFVGFCGSCVSFLGGFSAAQGVDLAGF